ncbi:MAG TPA: GNAT family protein [Acidimicrobiales bacterium]|nr:GNAT family protein [Acidimicrobiales bacterium]
MNAGQESHGWPSTPTLSGRLVSLEPLKTEHADALLPTASDPEVWRWKLTPLPRSVTDMEAIIDGALLASPDGTPRMAFLARRVADGAVIGSTTLYDLSMPHRSVENGETWLARPCWGQGFNEDMKYLVLEHCFETWGLARVAWRADHLNSRSLNALRRCGFVYEGTLRSHRQRPDGSRRDSVYFSVLVEEWPGVAEHLMELVARRSVGRTG